MKTPLVLLVLGTILNHVTSQTIGGETCSRAKGHEAVIQPDAQAFIAGFFAMHNSREGSAFGCGDIYSGHMQAYEAVRWALDRLNKEKEELNGDYLNNTYVPGVKLGMVVNDFCSNAMTAISQAEELFPQFGSSAAQCQKDSNQLMLGMMGPTSSDDSKLLAKFAETRHLPYISYTASAPELSDAEMYPNFMRTVAQDGPLTQTIVDFVDHDFIGWKYVVVVYTDTSYGRGAYNEIRPRLAAAGICLTSAIMADPSGTSEATMDGILDEVLRTNTTGVIYLGTNDLLLSLLDRGESFPGAGKLQWIVTDSVSITDTFPGQKYPRGLISVVPAGRKIIEFEDHWVRIDNNKSSSENPENPWYKDMYMDMNKCRLPDTNSPYTVDCPYLSEAQRRNQYVQDQFVEPAVHAVFMYAHALKLAHQDYCGGVPGLCEPLRRLNTMDFYRRYLRNFDLTYGKKERVESLASVSLDPYNAAAHVKFVGNDVVNPSFEVYSFNAYPYGTTYKFQNVGSKINNLLEIINARLWMYDEERENRLDAIPRSDCPSQPCSPCLGALVTTKYLYIPGDVVVNGLFSVHGKGDHPLTCGDLIMTPSQGIQYVEAFIHAINFINNDFAPRYGLLDGVKLGALGFDDCMSPVLSNQLITEVQRYAYRVTDENGENELHPRTIEAYLGGANDPLALAVTEQMNQIHRPVMIYHALTETLDTNDMYHYHIRLHYNIRVLARTIVQALIKQDWKYVQSVYEDDMYSEEYNDVFRRVAAEEGICVVASYKIAMDGGAEVVDHLRGRSNVKPVIVLAGYHGVRTLMQGMKDRSATGEFQFISVIGDSTRTIAGYETEANGMISIGMFAPTMKDQFEKYLRTIDVLTYKTNPWFREWYEKLYTCSFDSVDPQNKCEVERFYDDIEVNAGVTTILFGIEALTRALDDTLQHFCGAGYNGVCGDFLNAKDKGMILLEKLEQTRFQVPSNQPDYRFLDKQGNIPYRYYVYNKNFLIYSVLGDYQPADDIFTFSATDTDTLAMPLAEITSECPGVCMECLYLFRYQKFMYVDGDILIPGIFDVHYRGDSPYTCSAFRAVNGFQYTEAFRFALDRVNNGAIDLHGVKLGGLGFDGCSDHIRASAIVTGIYSGAYPRPDTNIAGVDFEIQDLAGWLSYDSDSTVSVARYLQRFTVPAVSPGATTPLLDDKSKFTTFFRTIPSDGVVAEAMAKLSNQLGFDYIITLNDPDAGSRDSVRIFREYAQSLGICIGASYEFETDGDAEQILQYILQSTTKVVAVFASPDRYIPSLLRQSQITPGASDLIFVANNPWTAPVSDPFIRAPRNTIMFYRHDYDKLTSFRYYLANQQLRPDEAHVNPWIREYIQWLKNCTLPGSKNYNSNTACDATINISENEITEDIWVIPTINAVYSLAEGIRRTLESKCGINFNSICANFISGSDTYDMIMSSMDAMVIDDITGLPFRFIEREADTKIHFKRFDDLGREQEEGSYEDSNLKIKNGDAFTNIYLNVPAQCIGQCAQCDLTRAGDEEFMYSNGDFHIAGLFDIHKQGATPYTCGEINDVHGFQLVEAFNWALEYVNTHQGMFKDLLPGVHLGSIIFDTCSSPVRAGNLVANFHAGNVEYRTDFYKIDPNWIDMYVGPLRSEAAIRVADVLNELGVPQISYGASSLELRDQRKYRYFMRTVPADDKQARALISFLKKYEFHNIQLITQFSTVGENGREEFLRLAPLNKICVSAEFVIGEEGPISELEARDIIDALRNKPDARVVVLIMDDPYVLLREINKYDSIVGNYSFIGTDKWGYGIAGYENLKGLDRIIADHNVVTLDIETADYPELDKYLEDKTPETYTKNPWFKDYYEYIFNCSLTANSPKYLQQCNSFLQGYPRADNYIQDPYALYVINAVFATAIGIHHTVYDWCQESGRFFGVCPILRTYGERHEEIIERTRNVRFVDRTLQDFFFTEDGESDRGYHIYEPIENGLGGYYWYNIGHYNDSHYLKMDVRYEPEWVSSCDAPGSCQCVFPGYNPSRYLKKESPQDLNIAYVGNIHARDPSAPFGCGAIDTGSDMQNLFAFLFAIQMVNENQDSVFPSSLKLGGVALDTCSEPSRIGQDVYSLLSGEPVCGSTIGQVVPPASIVGYMVGDSQNSIAVSSMLSPLKVTTISRSATSVELSDKLAHDYFLRTVPPDNVQAKVVGEILRKFGWDYVSVVYADNSYGRSAVATLLTTAEYSSPQLCVGRIIPLAPDASLDEAKTVIDELNKQIGARVVVVFVMSKHIPLILQATTEKGLNHRFLWIGSDTWADNSLLTKDYQETADGAITIQIQSAFSKKFREFMKSVTFNDRKGLPDDWFEELYQTLHQCRILSSVIKKSYTRICTGDETLTDDMIPQDPFVLHTIMSVFQYAYGLSNIDACKLTDLTLSSCLSLLSDRRQQIYDNILGAQHTVLADDLGDESFEFRFTSDGYGDIDYNILNFIQNASSGQYEYTKIGTHSGVLDLERRNYQSYMIDKSIPASRCSYGGSCRCMRQNGTTYPYPRKNQGVAYYETDKEGEYVDPKTGEVVRIKNAPEVADRFRDIWGIIVATLAAMGTFSALCLFVYLLIVYPVRGGTSVLGYMLSFGTILMYALVFVFLLHANDQVCAIRRFCLGLIYSIVYAALFVKLVDCWRTRNTDDIYDVKYKRIGQPWGLFLVALLLILVQVLINTEWLILEPPGWTRVIYNDRLWPRCTPDDFYDEGLILSNVYIMVLIFLCVMTGLLAFGNEKNHWECRWILGCVVLTIPGWMVWCLVAGLGEYKMRDAAVAIGLLYNASVMLLCGPLRKLYLLNKYQAIMDEEERKSQLVLSNGGSGVDYNAMYGQQYDNAPRMHESDSVRDSSGHDDVFLYEPKS